MGRAYEESGNDDDEAEVISRLRELALSAGGCVRAVATRTGDGYETDDGVLVTFDDIATARVVRDRCTTEGRNAFYVEPPGPGTSSANAQNALAAHDTVADWDSASSRSSSPDSITSTKSSEATSLDSSNSENSGGAAEEMPEQDDVHLRVPENGRLWLMSPPGSPPVGWTLTREHPPNERTFSDDLFRALRDLGRVEEFRLDGNADNANSEASLAAHGPVGQQFQRPLSPAPQRTPPGPTVFSTGSDDLPVIVVEDWSTLEGASHPVEETATMELVVGGHHQVHLRHRCKPHHHDNDERCRHWQQSSRIPQTALPPLRGFGSH